MSECFEVPMVRKRPTKPCIYLGSSLEKNIQFKALIREIGIQAICVLGKSVADIRHILRIYFFVAIQVEVFHIAGFCIWSIGWVFTDLVLRLEKPICFITP